MLSTDESSKTLSVPRFPAKLAGSWRISVSGFFHHELSKVLAELLAEAGLEHAANHEALLGASWAGSRKMRIASQCEIAEGGLDTSRMYVQRRLYWLAGGCTGSDADDGGTSR